MTVPLATLHPYTLEFIATVKEIRDQTGIILENTYFYPTGGGQPFDTGVLRLAEKEYLVIDVKKQDGVIVHIVDADGLAVGDTVECVIDQPRREKLRRMHTATHVLCAVIERASGAKVTGNQIGEEKTRIDFDLERNDPELMRAWVDEANAILASGVKVQKSVTTRDVLLQRPEMVKLAMGFPEHVTDVHLVDIPGADVQPCGGTHCDTLSEIGRIVFLGAETRGKNRRRVYIGLEA